MAAQLRPALADPDLPLTPSPTPQQPQLVTVASLPCAPRPRDQQCCTLY
uniref:Uncharacterized protein n=1 Tax=Arundo donax TaxID=35708 RepID=A0A0A9FFX2_ARUDO